MRIGAIVALGATLAAVAVISGSNRLPGGVQSDDEFAVARVPLDAALDRTGVLLNSLVPAAETETAPEPGELSLEERVRNLAARRKAIVHALDSLEAAPGDAWRGAMPGLRASVADLEARVDRAWIASTDSVAGLDALYSAWLADVDRRLDELESVASGELSGAGGHGDELAKLRELRTDLGDRLARIAGRDRASPGRDRLGAELIALRRQLRALERTADRTARLTRFP